MHAVSVSPGRAEDIRRELHMMGVIDRSVRMVKREGRVLIPLRRDPDLDLERYGAHLVEVAECVARPENRNPVDALRERLEVLGVPWETAPKKWERLGDVVVIRIPERGRPNEAKIARAFADALRVETVVEDVSGIRGVLRVPEVRVLLGTRTETVHLEGGVRYKLDVARVMFSSGNLAERLAAASLVHADDVIVDLFAGIGYFTLPIAVHSRASVIHACELNPVAFRYLQENLRLNRVSNVVSHLGDCRETAPRGLADVVLMGHFSARDYLDVAFDCLRGAGTVAYHELCPREQFPYEPIRRVTAAAMARWYDVESAETRIVKSYAPGIVHAVVEARVRRRPKGLSEGRSSPAR